MRLKHLPRDAVRFFSRCFGGSEQARIARVRGASIKRGSPHTLPGQLVVSLTSHPPRFRFLDLTLRGLLSQSVAPDVLVLWLAKGDAGMLPENVTALQRHGLTIRECVDMRSAAKLVPALAAYPDAFVVTADDDVQYPDGWLRRFVEEYRAPTEILAQRSRRMMLTSDGGVARYDEWPLIDTAEAGPHVFPTGTSGVLYPPRTLSPEVASRANFLRLCPHADDAWFYWMARRAGATHRAIAPAGDFLAWPSSRRAALWRKNRRGGNDKQIAAMVATYGLLTSANHSHVPVDHKAERRVDQVAGRVLGRDYGNG